LLTPISGDHSAIKGVATGGDSATLVPIVVGCLVVVAIVAVVAFFVVRRRRNRSLYDAEKADANGKLNGNGAEETQKLNADTQNPEA
jgi:LPXTG-motif cell wall-anchored protein